MAHSAPILPQSPAYHHVMQRVVALIALIFAFASLAGATTAHAHRYVSTPIVVLNHVDENNRSIPVFVQIQRGEIDLGSGIVMPCGAHHAIAANPPQVPEAPDCETLVTQMHAAPPFWSQTLPLRPPIAA